MILGGGPAYGVKSIRSKKTYLNINLNDLISIIPEWNNELNRCLRCLTLSLILPC